MPEDNMKVIIVSDIKGAIINAIIVPDHDLGGWVFGWTHGRNRS